MTIPTALRRSTSSAWTRRTHQAIAAEFGDGEWLAEAVAEFHERDLMVELDGQYLSLALPKNRLYLMRMSAIGGLP